ncbi:glycosyltransferase family 4 protein [Tolypothrix sp. PCC 7910]|uniref:glycosyltransferase family 4 protein n=1 Tax=Tolypothrix sp. PCC 7910 TaxID=2099387 RepID=UPI00142786CB|nr:glycosyltransferase family 4 protein [Tolypothrix sp. PCC 7910]QIR37967.1 glycosyltransferase family 4 protein [Tolypothrix sp. PCC 7910]
MKEKILILVENYNLGGVKSTVDALIHSELKDKFEFKVLSIKEIDFIKNFQPKIILFNVVNTWRNILKLLSIKIKNPYTKIIIIEHHYSRCFEQYNVPNLSRFHFMLKLSYTLAEHVISISQNQCEWMLQNHLLPSYKVSVIESCRLLETFFAISSKPLHKPIILGAYGRFCLQKGFDVLLKAMKLVSPTEVTLLLEGEGTLESELKQLAQGLDNVILLGRVNDVPSFLEKCDAVVIPSIWEPWGLVCLEAKAAGKPVIASDVDGLSEQVYNCGILVTPQDPVKLAQAITSLSNQDLEIWGKAGRESVKNAWQNYIIKLEALIEEML